MNSLLEEQLEFEHLTRPGAPSLLVALFLILDADMFALGEGSHYGIFAAL